MQRMCRRAGRARRKAVSSSRAPGLRGCTHPITGGSRDHRTPQQGQPDRRTSVREAVQVSGRRVLADRRGAGRLPGRQAAGRGEERRLVLPADQRAVHAGAEPASQIRLQEPEPGGRSLPAPVRHHRRGPAQGRRRRPRLRCPACRARAGGRPDPVPGSSGPGDHRGSRPRLRRQHRRVHQHAECDGVGG